MHKNDMSPRTKDRIGGLVLAVVGCGVVAKAAGDYALGTASRMGPGFMPTVYGVLIALVGVCLIAVPGRTGAAPRGTPAGAVQDRPQGAAGHAAVGPPDLRGAAAILGGLVAFIAAGASVGFAPASFLAVFIAALGDPGNRLKDGALMAIVLTLVAALVFSYGLGLQLPLFRWF